MNNLSLKDNSNNDYQLVNELSKLVRSYYAKNKPVDRKFVESVVSICMANDNIELSGRGVSFTDDMYCLGYFDGDKIYYNYMHSKDESYIMKVSSISDHKELNYFNAMSTLIHEFTHVKQCAVANGDDNMSKIYNFCFDVNMANPDFYYYSYDNLPIERYADIRGYYISYLVMERLGFDGLFYRKKFLSSLLNGYYLDMFEKDYSCDDSVKKLVFNYNNDR